MFKIDGMINVPKIIFILMHFVFIIFGAFQLEFNYQLEVPFYSGGWIILFALINFLLYAGHFLENTPVLSLKIEDKPEKALIINTGRFRKKNMTLKLNQPHFIEFGKTHFNVSWGMVLLAQLWLAFYFSINGLELTIGTAYEQGLLFFTYGVSMFIMIAILWLYPDIELIFSDGNKDFVFLMPSKSLKTIKNKSFFDDMELFLNKFKQVESHREIKRSLENKQEYIHVIALLFLVILAGFLKFYYYQFVDVIATALILLALRRYLNYKVLTQRNIHPTETALWFFLLNELAFKLWYVVGIGIINPIDFNALYFLIALIVYILVLFSFWLRINKWWSTTTQKKKKYVIIGLAVSIGIPILNILSAMQILPFYITILNLGPPI